MFFSASLMSSFNKDTLQSQLNSYLNPLVVDRHSSKQILSPESCTHLAIRQFTATVFLFSIIRTCACVYTNTHTPFKYSSKVELLKVQSKAQYTTVTV